ncbi:Beta-lactamase superfamily domain-containing protein [Clostridium cavendishii DSM 21758]|uniref:Beta-lactamase superfamily domain-containing protein n=2 Tax=Clostridium TaxID=1485 RepID=A0A1M6CCZ6_9CLOT|nr:Beta-lactamase superfamily domain-containing protein [Clostridium cavendishii DSM 21758]
MIDEMKNLKDKNIDYALLPYDGQFNMGPEEMSKAAKLINAKHVIPIHGISRKPSEIKLDNLLILNPKERIELIKSKTIY